MARDGGPLVARDAGQEPCLERAGLLRRPLEGGAGQSFRRSDRDGVFLYCLSYVSGALMAGRVDANGTLTEITPALSAPGFVPAKGSILIRRP